MFDPDARGVIAGLTLGHGRAELYRAALEGIAYGVRHNLEAMGASGGLASRLVAVGGGTQGGLWTQIVSDVTGMQQQVPVDTIGAALGDALLAAVAVGLEPDIAAWNPVRSTVEPDAERRAAYDEFYPYYRALYSSTWKWRIFSPIGKTRPGEGFTGRYPGQYRTDVTGLLPWVTLNGRPKG